MAKYVDGFVVPLPKDKVETYRKMATEAAKVWMEHGALSFTECLGDDLDIKQCLSFPAGIRSQEGETIVFSWIQYASKESRDKVNELVMKDPRITGMCEGGDMPFDPNRMLYGGFQVIVEG